MDYLNMLLGKYFSNTRYLRNHLIEEQGRAEKEEGIDHKTFFKGCNIVIDDLNKQIENLKAQKLKQLKALLNEGYDLKDEDLIKYAEQEIEAYSERNAVEKLFISFSGITENEERLYPSHIRDIADNIKWAKTDVYLKKTASNGEELGKEKLSKEEPENLHNDIFRNNAFKVWEAMFNDFGIEESSRSDVKFIFHEMKKEGLLLNSITQKDFLNWIADTYDLSIGRTSNHSRTKHRLLIYSNAKELYSKEGT